MSPRRKKADGEESEASVEDVTDSAPKPKKPRATRKKAPAKKAEADVGVPMAPRFEPPVVPRQPVTIPIKPIPPISVPPRIKIEPEMRLGDEIEDLWKPSPRGEADLSTPP